MGVLFEALKLSRQKQPPEVFYEKNVFLEISQNSQKILVPESPFLADVFPYEFCEISKKTFFTEHLWTAASEKIQNCIPKGNIITKET